MIYPFAINLHLTVVSIRYLVEGARFDDCDSHIRQCVCDSRCRESTSQASSDNNIVVSRIDAWISKGIAEKTPWSVKLL